jgi:hypothetical protein
MREDRQQNAGQEKAGGQDRRGAREQVGRATAGQETAAAATDTERAAFGALPEHDRNKCGCNHDVNDE